MTKVVFVMAMSLDGFVNDEHGSVELLYPDFAALDNSDLMKELIDNTGAVLMGKRTFEMPDDPDWYAGNYEFQRPIFVLTNQPPSKQPKQTEELTFTFVTDGLESALQQAKAAAGNRQVTVVGGPNIMRQLLQQGWLDELQIGIMPVLLGKGLRLFEHFENLEIKLDKIKIQEAGPRTDIWFRVVK
jgi:dihydrofolate reductase